ncbi:MAG TPA: transcription elongation factor GreB [Polyangiaceae bacterium]|nr:transcription elongation factor GreB [Polyangiaceae bacterium]
MSERAGNYITREGAKRLQAELASLRSRERPQIVQQVADAAAQGDRSENAEYIYGKKKLREIDGRIHWLTKRLESLVVVEPRPGSVVYFGAYVDVEDESGQRTTYRIVGEDEVEPLRGHVSWRSPLGNALLRHRAGDVIRVNRPSGLAELKIFAVRY